MTFRRLLSLSVFLLVFAVPAFADDTVPFKGTWSGSTISATPISETVVLVVSSGSGNATQLGRFVMTSPHLTYLDTLAVEGTQVFVAPNGDTINATISGQFVPTSEGLEATLAGVITGGTGRFAGATGSYDFHIVARPAAFGFDSTATIDGTITTVGSRH